MKLFTFWLIVGCCFIDIHTINGELNCSIYPNEIDFINLNPFYVRSTWSATLSSFSSYPQRVTGIYIVNDINPTPYLFCLKNLESLQLVNTNLTILPDIQNLRSLTTLVIQTDLGSNGEHLPSEIGQLTSLISVDLTDIENLKDLPSEVEYWTNLRTLNLAKLPNLESIPAQSLSKITKLSTLSLIDLPKLSYLPSPMENFQQLNSITLVNTNLADLHLQNLNLLTTLNITGNAAMKSIQIKNMTNLGILTSSNNYALVTVDIKNLSRIQSLSFASLPQLQTFSVENASMLTYLNLSGNPQLKTLEFINTPNIKQLDLSGCQFTSFPESVLMLTSLETLRMQSNQLSSLPSMITTYLPKLATLILDNNQFQGNIILPPLISVRILSMINNSLTTLNGIGEYKSLEQLTLDSNQITSIPLEIMRTSSNLYSFSINNNPVNQIPYQMANMRALKTFQVMNNSLTTNERAYLTKLFRQTAITFKF